MGRFTPFSLLLSSISALGLSAGTPAMATEVAIQVQIGDYEGHEAYFVVYLADADGRYQRTLWISGAEQEYQEDLVRWWRYAGRSDEDFDAVTGASTPAGGRVLIRTELSDEELAGGSQLVVDTGVEDQRVVAPDVIMPLSEEAAGEKTKGVDYVQFIRYRW